MSNPNNPSVLETRYSEGRRGEISVDVNKQMLSIREFRSTEEIAGLIVLGSSVEPELPGKRWE